MSKLDTAKKVFEIGKIAADIYSTLVDGRQKERRMEEKDKRIADLEAENKKLKEKLGEKS